ncbi:hypothetical protein G7046_g9650 [Stylonectria norvegica]|nr:hypothetical protein G7046_g9650 [Stylonectria norvegica]
MTERRTLKEIEQEQETQPTQPPYQEINNFHLLRRHLLTLPIPTLPSLAQLQPPYHIDHPLRRKLRTEQAPALDTIPEALAQLRLHRARVIAHRKGIITTPRAQVIIKALPQATHARLARAVRVPPASAVVRDGAHARRHAQPRRVRGEGDLVCLIAGLELRGALGQELAKVLHQQQRAQGVEAEALEALFRVDLLRVLLDDEHAGDGAGEAQVVRLAGEELGGALGG